MSRFYLLLLPLALLLTTCGDDSATNSSGGSQYVLRYPQESSTLALVESREFRPPPELLEKIDRELAMIRDQWGDSIPAVLLTYNDPWMGQLGIFAGLDTVVLFDTVSPERRALDSTMAHFGARLRFYSDFYPGIFPDHPMIVPDEPWYPPSAVDSFAGLPGIQYLMTEYVTTNESWHTHVRRAKGNTSFWFFGSDCNWTDRMQAFEVRGRRSAFVDEYHSCFCDLDSAQAVWRANGISAEERALLANDFCAQSLANMPEWYRSVQWEIYYGFDWGGDHFRLWQRSP